MNCTNCSANIPSDALTCPYCGTETPNFAKARAREEQNQRHAHQQSLIDAAKARQAAVATLEGSAKTAFFWSLAGVFICCFPIGSIVSIVLSLRVRKTAAAANAPAPTMSMISLILSGLTLSFFIFALCLGIYSNHQKSLRVQALREATRTTAAATALDAATACDLVEMVLLEGGAGLKSGNLELFRCAGAVETSADGKAVIRDIEYSRTANDPPITTDGCLSRGSRWKVDAIGRGPGCRATADAGVE